MVHILLPGSDPCGLQMMVFISQQKLGLEERLPRPRLTDPEFATVPSDTRAFRTQPDSPLFDFLVRDLDHRNSMQQNARDLALIGRFRGHRRRARR